MKIESKKLYRVIQQVAKYPSLAVALFALTIPMIVLYGATKFVEAPIEAMFFFGALGIVSLIYSIWIFYSFENKFNGKTKHKAYK